MKNPLFKLNRWLVAASLGAACLASPLTSAADPLDYLKDRAREKLNEDHDRRYGRDRDRDRRDWDRDRRDWDGRREWDGRRGDSTDAAVQRALSRRGYFDGRVDGSLGPGSRSAISRYQRDRGLPVTGTVTPSLLRSLGISG